MNEKNFFKKVIDVHGVEHKVAMDITLEGKRYIITLEQKILLQDENGNISECPTDDKNVKIFNEMLKPAKSLDIIGDGR